MTRTSAGPEAPPTSAPARIVVLTGPTATGKSALALELAEETEGEIVSADSMQVYRHLDIGTAKPSVEERSRIPHHLVDFLEPSQPYNAGRFIRDADAAIADIRKRGRLPIVCGGTALYIRALLHGLAPDTPRNPEIRADLEAAWEAGDREFLRRELRRVDPALAARLHPNDRIRIMRGLEVYRAAGQPLSSYQERHGFRQCRYSALLFGIGMERSSLYRRIDQRVLEMMAAGWVEEVRTLLESGLPPTLPPFQAIGYKQIVDFLQHGGGMDERIAEIQKQTRRFAKRQMTWFRRWPLEWVAREETGRVTESTRKFLQTQSQSI